ncbi:MAG TPA: dihydropteroate synthase [Burkholderiales bacterium]|nr:dihydropteroate synthase [Burkholderiales bacterium]
MGQQSRVLRAGRFKLPLHRPLIMGIVNVTPDSFSDGGRYLAAEAAIAHAHALAEEGADILDIGGESTRPGAASIAEEEELRRLLPVLEALGGFDRPISVDTRKPRVMQAALGAGASMINDIEALQAPGALDVVAGSDCAVCLMHKQGDPQTMHWAPTYTDVIAEVKAFLVQRVQACEAAGIGRERLVIDPGFGFGKNLEHNLALLRGMEALAELGAPLLVGLSRKSMLGKITGRAPSDRLAGSIALAMLAVERGAAIVRVHDVAATRDAFLVQQAVVNPDEQA